MNHSILAKNIKFLRTRNKINQTELSEKIGLTRGKVASYELGKAEPNVKNLVRIAKFFNIPMIDIVEKELSEEYFVEKKDGNISQIEMKSKLRAFHDENTEFLEKYVDHFTETRKIADGLKSMLNMKYKNKTGISEDIKGLVYNYESLLELMDDIIDKQESLINELKE